MELSRRLKAISDYVQEGAILADIGTDHGYIPIYLAKEGRVEQAYACDVNKGPLEKAKLNIKQSKVEDYVKTRLSDGLAKLEVGEVDTIIIAGMGGLLIQKIMIAGSPVLEKVEHMILSPHSDLDVVRQELHRQGFYIKQEEMLTEEGKYYTILDVYRGKDEPYDERDYKYGKQLIANRSAHLKEILQKKANKYQQVIAALEEQGTDRSLARQKEMAIELKEIREVIGCL